MTIEFPIRLPSLSNARLHWAARARIVKHQRAAVRGWILTLPLEKRSNPPMPAVVVLTRFVSDSRGELDTDNLQGALKAVRDEVATWLKVDDADPRVIWHYEQRVSRMKGSALRIKVVKATTRRL